MPPTNCVEWRKDGFLGNQVLVDKEGQDLFADVERFEPSLVNVAWRITNDRESARDAVQDAYLAVLESNGAFRAASSLKTYLYRIVINKCLDAQRGRRRRREQFALFAATVAGHADEDYETKDLLQKVLGAVPHRYRVPLVLAEVEGFTYEEIADVLRIPLNTVRTRVFRCRERLRREMQRLERPL